VKPKSAHWIWIGALVVSATASGSERLYEGRASMYRQLEPESLEQLPTPARILAVAQGKVAPMLLWKTLERGERVECLDCIAPVAELLYDPHPKNREISAWWLRRRIFGVFGPGEVHEQLARSVTDASQSEHIRAYAAEALGEMLSVSGEEPLARALISDPSPRVRVAAARALRRLNKPGPNQELAQALSDTDSEVRLAALDASLRVVGFKRSDRVVGLLEDDAAAVRRLAAQTLGALRVSGALPQLSERLSPQNEGDPRVRAAAAYALGELRSSDARPALVEAQSDPDPFVRDAVNIALRRL